MSFVGFLGDHVCTTRELILGRERGRAMLHSCSQFPGNSGCQPRIAASRRKHEGGVIQPKLDPPFRPPAERAIDPNACCFHRGGAAAGYAKKPGDGRLPRPTARLDGRGQSSCGCVAPLSAGLPRPWGAVPGQPRSSALWPWYIRQLLRRAYTLEYCWPSSGARRLPVEHYFGIRKMKVRRAKESGKVKDNLSDFVGF